MIERYNRIQTGFRRAHARGLVVQGTFHASPEARVLSMAEHLQGNAIPCLVRLSNSSGNPCAPDSNSPKQAQVTGLAIRFQLPSGAAATWAAATIPAFPARNPAEFIATTTALARGGNGKPNPFRLVWHILTHLHILPSIKGINGLKPAGSFAMETYNGVHTYYLVNAAGVRKPFRYRWVPHIAHVSLSPAEVKGRPAQYLLNEIKARLGRGPVSWDLTAVFPEPGDPLDDAFAVWPEGRSQVTLGRLVVDKVHADQRAVDNLVFDPTGVVPGLELSDDPLLRFRSQVYGLSFARRSGEQRGMPAPADMDQP